MSISYVKFQISAAVELAVAMLATILRKILRDVLLESLRKMNLHVSCQVGFILKCFVTNSAE